MLKLIDFARAHPGKTTVKRLRTYVAKAKEIGADVWIHRVGIRVYIDEAKFFEWHAKYKATDRRIKVPTAKEIELKKKKAIEKWIAKKNRTPITR